MPLLTSRTLQLLSVVGGVGWDAGLGTGACISAITGGGVAATTGAGVGATGTGIGGITDISVATNAEISTAIVAVISIIITINPFALVCLGALTKEVLRTTHDRRQSRHHRHGVWCGHWWWNQSGHHWSIYRGRHHRQNWGGSHWR